MIMYRDKKVSVVIPAYNEEKLVGRVIETMPLFVDWIIVVDDASTDRTSRVAKSIRDNRVIVLRHGRNQGVGGAILTGHRKALELGVDISAVMAGDAQMDPQYLPLLLNALIDEDYDYAKGNRFLVRDSLKKMPKIRVLGNAILTFFTKLASGYWHIFDPQNGYTTIKTSVLKNLELDEISRRYEFENDMLINLNMRNYRVKDVAIPALYGNEKSGIRLYSFIPRTSLILMQRFLRRINEKYVLRNFHPIALLLGSGMLIFLIGSLFGFYIIYLRLQTSIISTGTVMLSVLPLIIGFQLLLAAFILDIIETPK
ncbi:MAG: glycosyltransferase family 2 protein [Candidatus Altiarchaeota archaeon]|nr:glycosyltransferase family 2 protein [Candidatus Altiarchaeota archaeon]